jgi:mannose/fructose-specific phosphotransferase system component IIA
MCRSEPCVEVVTGVNLPMLLKANALRKTRALRELAPAVVESVKGSIAWATQGHDTSL